ERPADLVAGDPGQRGVEYCRSRPSCPEELQRLKPIRGLGRAKTRAFEEGRELSAIRIAPAGSADVATVLLLPPLGHPTSNPKVNALQETLTRRTARGHGLVGCSP